MGTLYVRRSTQIAATSGFCLLCEGLLNAGEPMAILVYGGKASDWGRAHPSCADQSASVVSPDTAKVAAIAASVEQPTHESAESDCDYVELPKGHYRGFDKYVVRLKGKPVWYTSDRRRAEGAVAFHQAIRDLAPA